LAVLLVQLRIALRCNADIPNNTRSAYRCFSSKCQLQL